MDVGRSLPTLEPFFYPRVPASVKAARHQSVLKLWRLHGTIGYVRRFPVR